MEGPDDEQQPAQEVLRLLIDDVTLRNVDDPWSTEVAIRWKTGVVTRHRAERVQPHPQPRRGRSSLASSDSITRRRTTRLQRC